jgi:ubiquinone/menaquinone biosynthesis C-methylase UbiE
VTASSPAYSRFADIYDRAYHFVDYRNNAAWLREQIQSRRPDAHTVLEVACGTGRYLEQLAPALSVEGLDRSPEMLAVARRRLPDVPLHRGDMTDFDLPRRYDVVCCLFRSIAYVGTVDRLRSTVAAMARHLNDGGLLIIEPFFTPDTYWVDRVTLNHYQSDDLALAWMYVSERDDTLARLRIHCLVGTPAGVEHFVELHEFGLFTRADFAGAFEAVGLHLEYEPHAPGGTGLYVGCA